MPNTSDVIIIGCGVHGASLAFHLALKGVQAIIIEKNTAAAGATGRSSGLVRMHYDLEPESRLAWESFQYFSDWEARVGGDCGFTRTGFLQFVPPKHMDALRANIAMHQRIGILAAEVSPEDVQRLAPQFYVNDIQAAAYEPESGYADPHATTMTLLAAAKQRGASLVHGSPVTAIHVKGGKVTGVATPQGDFFAPVVVNAAGAWAGPVAALAEVALPLTTWRHEVIFAQRPPEMSTPHPTVIDDINEMYFRPETGGLTLVGLEDGNVLGEDPGRPTDRARPGFAEKAIDRICKRIPAMEKASLHSSQAGYDGLSPDQRAVLGPAGPDGFYLQCGFSGTGFKIAPAVGACMAELIMDEKARLVDITPFGYQRLLDGTALKGEHAYDKLWR